VFRVMVRQAGEVIVVADSSKLGMVCPAVICPPRDIDLPITDDGISMRFSARLPRATFVSRRFCLRAGSKLSTA
jgi:DeoR/GlpR family transcriptional regulator of sugar metabolism